MIAVSGREKTSFWSPHREMFIDFCEVECLVDTM